MLTVDEWVDRVEKYLITVRRKYSSQTEFNYCNPIICSNCPFSMEHHGGNGECLDLGGVGGPGGDASKKIYTRIIEDRKNMEKNIKLIESL